MFIRAEQTKTSDRGLTPAFVADRMNPGRGLQSFPLVAVLSVGADGAAFFVFNEILNISKNVEIVGNVGKWHSR